MNNPKMSVIMAVYNSEKYLDEAIESILNQTLKDFEFIIINDASTDNSSNIIKKYKTKDKRIIVINNKKNLGRAKARNKALKIAKRKYIAILDSDDIALPERLEKQFTFLEKNKDIFLVGGGAINITENNKEITKFRPITEESKLKETLKKRNTIYHSTVMFRNKKANFYREKFKYAQDYDFYLNLLTKGKKLINIPKILIKYRLDKNSISFSKRTKQNLFAKKAREFYFQRLKDGKDYYDRFDPNEILNLNIGKSKDKNVLESEIKTNFKLNDLKKTRKYCKKYFKYHGYFNKILIYYFTSFLGKRIINFLRKIVFD